MGIGSMSKTYDVIVVGVGSMGMSAGYELAQRGASTLLIDAFDPPHGEGSHHGEPRLIRHVYNRAEYVNLALRSDEKWRQLEEVSGQKLLERSGVLNLADPNLDDLRVRQAFIEGHCIDVEWLNADEIRKRWPQLRVPDSFVGMYEAEAGYLYSEACIAAYKRLALAAGAKLLANTFVTGLVVEKDNTVTVHTGKGSYCAERVVLSAGAWFKTLQPFVSLPIRSVRKVAGWFEASTPAFDAGVFPGFTINTRNGDYYGFPSIGGKGVKIGRHDGGVPWEPGEPLEMFGAYAEDEKDLRKALEAHFPGAAGRLLRGVACKYELSPDEGFIIDQHPLHENIIIAGGFSGHGFKFASVVGEIVADLALAGNISWSLEPFRLSRFTQ